MSGDEEALLKTVAFQNASTILKARRRAEDELIEAKLALEQKTEELALSLAMMSATFDASSDGILVTDDRNRVTAYNEKFVQMWQIPSEVRQSTEHRRFASVMSGFLSNPAEFLATEERLDHSGESTSFDVLELTDRRIVERLSSPQLLGGRRVGRVWMYRDITHQRQVEQGRELALRQAQDSRDATEDLNRHLRSLLHEMESFSSSIAHDLRAPLVTLSGFSQVLLNIEKERLSPRGQKYLDKVVAAAERMDKIIAALLDIARMPHKTVQRAEIDVAKIARAVVAELQAADPQRCAEVQIAGTLPVVGDPVLVQQVMANLVGNCWKFSAHEDVVRIEIGRTMTPRGEALFVRDHGAGFDSSHAEHLFKMFYRMHADNEFSGSGVGLAIVKRIVERHGGTIWAESALGEGATFYFTLSAPDNFVAGTSDSV